LPPHHPFGGEFVEPAGICCRIIRHLAGDHDAMARRPDFASCIETVYAASVDPAKWTAVLSQVRGLCEADSAAMTIQHISAGSGTRITSGYDSTGKPSYFDGFAAINPLFRQLLARPAGVPYPHQMLVDDDVFRRGPYFNEYCRPNNLHFMAGLVIRRRDEAVEWLTLNRGHRRTAYDDVALSALKPLVPHIRRASDISRRLGAAGMVRQTWETALDRLTHAVVLLDRRGGVVFANQGARLFSAANDGFVLRGRRVSASAAANRLERLIGQATMGDASGVRTGGQLTLPRRAEPHPLSASVIPLPREAEWQTTGAPAVLMVIADPAHPPTPESQLLTTMFGLTEREAALTATLAAGLALGDAAEQLGIGRETARTHLAHALAKTGCARQVDLVRLALATVPPAKFA
jgi:DNA-binding CsgD family transcriptional regulator